MTLRSSSVRLIRRTSAVAGVAVISVLVAGSTRAGHSALSLAKSESPAIVADSPAVELISLDSLTGLSGKLRARFIPSDVAPTVPLLAELFGESVVGQAGVYAVDSARASHPFAFISMRPFAEKKNGRIGSYRIGNWPYERRSTRNLAYANPRGFIEVTAENQDTYVSEHFRLRDFLTKDQHAVWPKYLVLDARLLDKLELVIAELSRSGVAVHHVSVMSGFRTPQYNQKGVGAGGRAQTSRHQYGDAADVFVDNDRNGRLDDLNDDGRVNTRDVAVMVAAVERVERAHPELIGGAGTYKATSSHGPFVHIDARGNRARW